MLAAILMESPTEELMVADDVTLRDLAPGDVKVKIEIGRASCRERV